MLRTLAYLIAVVILGNMWTRGMVPGGSLTLPAIVIGGGLLVSQMWGDLESRERRMREDPDFRYQEEHAYSAAEQLIALLIGLACLYAVWQTLGTGGQ